VCACHIDVSANHVDHHGELLVQNGTLFYFAMRLAIRLSEHKSGQTSLDLAYLE
jgi:hypothetical protein